MSIGTTTSEHERLLLSILDAEPGTVYVYDLEQHQNVYLNRAWTEQFGYSAEETQQMGSQMLSQLLHPDDLGRIQLHHEGWANASPEVEREIEYRVRCKSGGWRWVCSRESSFKQDAKGRITQILGFAYDITERKRLELDRQRFVMLAESSSEFIGMCDLELQPLYVNPAGMRMVGLPDMTAACRVKVQDYFFPEDQRFIGEEFFPRVMQEGHGTVEIRLRHFQTGEPIWTSYYLFSVRDALGTPVGWATTSRDITERKLSEQILAKSELRYRTLFENMTSGFVLFQVIVDEQGAPVDLVVLAANAGFEKATGLRIAEVTGQRLTRILPGIEKDEAGWITTYGTVALSGQSRQFDVKSQLLDIWFSVSAFQAGPLQCAVTFVDISDRRRAEERIRSLNRTYVVLSDINQLIVRERRPQLIFEGACRIAIEKGGFKLAWVGLIEASARRAGIAAHAGASPDTVALLSQMFADPEHGCAFTNRALQEGMHSYCNDIARDPLAVAWREAALTREYRSMVSLPLNNGQRRIGMLNLYSSDTDFFDEGELHLLDELADDISFALEMCERDAERHRAREELQASEQRFRLLIENASDLITVVDELGVVRFQSPASQRVLGQPAEQLLGRNMLELVHPEDVRRFEAALRQILSQSTASVSVEYRFRHRDGAWRILNATGRCMPLASGQSQVVLNARDVTEQHQLEQQLQQAQKMEAIGQLAGGVAHDFNNILAAISLQSELSLSTPGLPTELVEGLQEICAAARRGGELTRQLLLFGRKQALQARAVDLGEIVTNMSKLLRRVIREDVQLQLHLHASPLVIHADPGMIEQVLMNLSLNARDAMPEGGCLRVETGEHYIDIDAARMQLGAVPGLYSCLSVADTGTGIPPEVLPHIFEPFFTTKELGKGTGLGLATVFGIVQQHHGWIKVQSEPGRGTRFEVYLPSSRDAVKPEIQESQPLSRGNGETILLVEDDPAVRLVTRATLVRHGYKVLEAFNGVEAMRIWKENLSTVMLLLTDMVMPGGIGGLQLAKLLQAEQPRLRVVYVSGYSAETAGRELELRPGDAFVQKPCTPTQLLAAIHRALRT